MAKKHVHQWPFIVRGEIDSPETLKYTLSNAPSDTSLQRQAQMQAQHFWVERALQDAKSESGLAEYQARKWSAWHHPIAPPDPVEAILFRMEQAGLQRKDLEPYIGHSGRVSEVLNHKRPLTLEMIRKLWTGLHIPLESLIQAGEDGSHQQHA